MVHRVTICDIFPRRVLAILYCFDSKYIERVLKTYTDDTDRSAHANKANRRYFRQYRNPCQDASRKNGTCGHPSGTHVSLL